MVSENTALLDRVKDTLRKNEIPYYGVLLEMNSDTAEALKCTLDTRKVAGVTQADEQIARARSLISPLCGQLDVDIVATGHALGTSS